MNDLSSKKRILIVDDTQESILILRQILVDYVRLVALDGTRALAIANTDPPPDLILLDIVMPDLDGYEVCRRLKERDKTREIPVIFLSAKISPEDEAKGFALGAVDYIGKPISAPVVLARVATHLAIRDAYRQMEQQYIQLKELDQLRKDVEAITRHDLKSPIDGIIGCADMMLAQQKTISPEDVGMFIRLIRDAARQLREMVNLSLNLIKIEQGNYAVTLQPTNLVPIIRRIQVDNQEMVKQKNLESLLYVHGEPDHPEASFIALCDTTLCYTLFANLYRNAMEASQEGQQVTVSLEHGEGEMARVSIHNAGVVPEEIQSHFFKKYATFGKKGGTGLGTYSARLMTEAQQGHIQMQSSEKEGTTLTVTLLTKEPTQ